MRIVLIRHTEQDYPLNSEGKKLAALKDTPLTDEGIAQAHSLAKELARKSITFDAIFTSPYERTLQTATILGADQKNVRLMETVDDLREVDPTSVIGHTLEEIDERGDIYADPFDAEQESLERLTLRMHRALAHAVGVSREKGFETIAIVSHGDPLAALLWYLRNDSVPTDYLKLKEDYPVKGEAYVFGYEPGRAPEGFMRVTTELTSSPFAERK